MLPGANDLFDALGALIGVQVQVGQLHYLGKAQDRVQRGAELVADQRQEIILRVVRGLGCLPRPLFRKMPAARRDVTDLDVEVPLARRRDDRCAQRHPYLFVTWRQGQRNLNAGLRVGLSRLSARKVVPRRSNLIT